MWRGNLARYRVPLGFYAAMSTVLIVQQHISNRVLRDPSYRAWPWHGLHYYVDGWSQFDGPRYEGIARYGYSYRPGHTSNIVWFPLYPLLMRVVHLAIHDFLISGMVITLLAGAVGVCLYWRWLTVRGMEGRTRLFAFGVLALYPYGWYLYGVVHADALFLTLLVAAFVLIEEDHLVWAGIVGALATASRPTGMAAIPALVVYGLQHEGVLTVASAGTGLVKRFAIPLDVDRTKLRAASFGPALSVAGLGSFMTYQWVRFGNPVLFITNEQLYHPGGDPWLKTAFFWRWVHFSNSPTYTLTITGQAIVAALVVWSVPGVCRRFGFAYGLFLVLLVATPTLSTEDFMGTGRYLMAAFPAFALFGERLAHRRRVDQATWLAICGGLMVFMAFLFARSTYLT